METERKLGWIAERARQGREVKFTSLMHHINEESLAESYGELKKNKASGIDGVRVEEYGEGLKERLQDLIARMKRKRYQPQPVRRVYIPKPGKEEKRGLGIPAVEDKVVQVMVKKILEAIYEGDFLKSSYGFRRGRNCHEAINRLDKVVMTKQVNYVVEVDIEKFFDRVSHYWLLRCLEERIKDPKFLWLLRRFLKAGVVEEGQRKVSEEGTPQGGVVSPVLANIYLHYVLDLWFERRYKPQARGYMEMIRYCDDLVVVCERQEDAEQFLRELEKRLAKFGLGTSKAKTGIMRFGRKAWKEKSKPGNKAATFTFLGFTHYCTKSRRGKFIVGHKTSKENLSRKLKEVNRWIKGVRNLLTLKEWWPMLKAKVRGHYSYFGISGNIRCLQQFYKRVIKEAYKWINRRSQKRSMTRKQYFKYLARNPLPQPRIYYSLYTLSPSK